MAVTFKGSLTLGQLVPQLSSALDTARDFLNGDAQSLDDEKKKGMLDDFETQITNLQSRISAAEAQFNQYVGILNTAKEVSAQIQTIVDDVADNLTKSGVYTYQISGESIGSLGGSISQAVTTNGPGEEDNLPSTAVCSGMLVIAVDGAAINAINNVLNVGKTVEKAVVPLIPKRPQTQFAGISTEPSLEPTVPPAPPVPPVTPPNDPELPPSGGGSAPSTEPEVTP